VFGIHLSYVCRNATTQFQERRFLCLAIVVEATVSGAFYVLRIIYSKSLHPDYSFLAYFTRSQLTSTVVLLVIFTPKARFIIWSEATHWRDFSTCSFSIKYIQCVSPNITDKRSLCKSMHVFINSVRSLSDDRSTASSKPSSPHSAI